MLFNLWTCQGEGRQLNMERWTNPCWSGRQGLFCQAGPNPEGLLLSQRGFIVHWHAEQMHASSGYLHLPPSPPPWSDLPILHHCPPQPRSAAAAVKRHAFIKCLPFQLLSSHVIFLLDHNLRPPPVSCIRSTADARGRWPALVLIWHGLN